MGATVFNSKTLAAMVMLAIPEFAPVQGESHACDSFGRTTAASYAYGLAVQFMAYPPRHCFGYGLGSPPIQPSVTVVTDNLLTVSNDNDLGGSVISDVGGIACGMSCGVFFASGTLIKLTAIPVAGYQFSGWGGACSGYANYCVVTMDAEKTVTANFEVFNRRHHHNAWKKLLSLSKP